MSHEDAIQALKKGAAAQWDPRTVDALIKVLERETKMLELTPSENG
jgi:HD-GYP domain-containing protein (c-di-GMP phosphodiesterase class II)